VFAFANSGHSRREARTAILYLAVPCSSVFFREIRVRA
jgi:hypothetical protein